MNRVAIIGFLHESNTFVTTRTLKSDFVDADFVVGEPMLGYWRDAHHELGGFVAGCIPHGLSPVPILGASATPGGVVTREAYEEIVAEILDGLKEAGPLAGVLLALHGAMCVEGLESADGETARRIRHAVGKDVPVVLTLDMHANVSPDLVLCPSVTIIYRTYPHIDQRQRGIEAAGIVARLIHESPPVYQALVKLPLLIHIVRQFTSEGPMRLICERLEEIAARPGILSASIAPGYIYADVPDMGVSVVVAAVGEQSIADEAAQELSDFVMSLREELNAALPDPQTAVRMAKESKGTVALMDCGDNVGGGGPGDSTILLREILRQQAGPACVILHDPVAVRECTALCTGEHVTLSIGDRSSDKVESRLNIEGEILAFSEGRFTEMEARHGGHRHFNQGKTVVLRTAEGHTIILNSLRVMPTSLQQLLSLGIDPGDFRIIVVKGATAPLAAYGPVCDRVIAVNTPGSTQAGPETFDYRRRPRPLYPLDDLDPQDITNWKWFRTEQEADRALR